MKEQKYHIPFALDQEWTNLTNIDKSGRTRNDNATNINVTLEKLLDTTLTETK